MTLALFCMIAFSAKDQSSAGVKADVNLSGLVISQTVNLKSNMKAGGSAGFFKSPISPKISYFPKMRIWGFVRNNSQFSKCSGVPRSKELTAANGADYIVIVSAMSVVENGVSADINQIIEGFHLQIKNTMPLKSQFLQLHCAFDTLPSDCKTPIITTVSDVQPFDGMVQ